MTSLIYSSRRREGERERGRKRRDRAAVTDYKENTGLTDDYRKQMAAPRTTKQLVSIERSGGKLSGMQL